LALTVAGTAIGLAFTIMAARVITTLFYGFEPDFVAAVIVAAAVLLTVATLACLVPARRASRINPVVALQQE
jgi:ABC-type antimicrobial peptide transport system permease subunit